MDKYHVNQLINEKSPYLLLHAHNPVNWYPWGETAFQKATQENKPIFLSIGYSTCHWCHVMERESFVDDEVAKVLNENFISIKVDREERPDIDNIYMNFCLMVNESGGWPLSIITTPDKKPFFAATYLPKKSLYNRPGLIELLQAIALHWKSRANEIIADADKAIEFLKKFASQKETKASLMDNITDCCLSKLYDFFDKDNGGFGERPKFPSPHNLIFLLRHYKDTVNENALFMVEKTLKNMRFGGVFDHVGGGFHRYSTDSRWFLPHFEKMLYDQAMLAMAYTEAYEVTKDDFYKTTAAEIFNYIRRDMTDKDGGFYSAEDAESEDEEGKFYIWNYEEIQKILGENAQLFVDFFNIKQEGNFFDEATGEKNISNIPHITKDYAEFAKEKNISFDLFKEIISESLKKLFVEREKRVHPLKDTKILVDWNSLAIVAFCKAARAFNNDEYGNMAIKAANFILNALIKDGFLHHRYKDNEVAIKGNINDYAFFIWALTELYQTTFDIKYLENAIKLQNIMLDEFWDDENQGFFFNPKSGEELIVRQKELFDRAIPSGNSVALLNLSFLYYLTGNTKFQEKASEIIQIFSEDVNSQPQSFTMFLTAFKIFNDKFHEIIIAGKNKMEISEIIREINSHYIPNKIIILKTDENPEIMDIIPFTENIPVENATKIYLCQNFSCQLPKNNVKELFEEIG